MQPQKSRNVAFGTLKNNEIVPQPLRNCSHQAKPKKAGAHPKRQSPSRFCVQAIAGVQPQKSRNVALEPLKTMKSCPSHCETSATRQSLRKLRRERIRKGRAPAGFASKHCGTATSKISRNVAFGIPKNNEIVPPATAKLQPPGKAQESWSASEKAEPQQVLRPSHCRSAASKISKRCVWNPQKKNNEIVPQPLRNFSHQAKPKKAASGAHPKRQSPSRFCVQAIAELQPQKSRNVAFGTPKNNEMKSCPSHCETAATRQSPKSCVGSASEKAEPQQVLRPSHCRSAASKISKRCFWNPQKKTKKAYPSHCETSATRQSRRKR